MTPTPTARAYYNHGRWITDCPRPGCANAQALTPAQWVFECSNCLVRAPVEWPPNAAEITAELDRRPVPDTRNWFPEDHPLALASGRDHGQTVSQLADEFHAMDPVSAKVTNSKGRA
jgi:hypothetical protein